jgi:hypothetical protein
MTDALKAAIAEWARRHADAAYLEARMLATIKSGCTMHDEVDMLREALEALETARIVLQRERDGEPHEEWKAETIAQVGEAVTSAVGVLAHEVANLKLRIALLEKAKP